MKVFLLDTNIFLQCRDLDQLPWKEIVQDAEVLLLISAPVQEEIDKLKQDGNSRRSQRAKKASTFLRSIILLEDLRLIIRDACPRVVASLPSPIKKDWKSSDLLDLSRNDDRIIEAALAYKSEYPESDVSVLTNDTGILLKAKRCGLCYTVIPDEWHLPPEPDSRDKRISELERKMREFEKNTPQIETSALGAENEPIPVLTTCVVRYTISDTEMENLMAEVRIKYPMETDFGDPLDPIPLRMKKPAALRLAGISSYFEKPSEESIREYKEVKYPNWLKKVEEYFKFKAVQLDLPSRHYKIAVSIANVGSVPAENLVIEFNTKGGMLIYIDDGGDSGPVIKFPTPPVPPTGRWVMKTALQTLHDQARGFEILRAGTNPDYFTMPNYQHLLENIPSIHSLKAKPKDKHLFYWKPERPSGYTNEYALECEEFRHQVEPEVFDMAIFIPRDMSGKKGNLSCRITAKNLSRPIIFNLPIIIEYRDEAVLPKLLNIIGEHETDGE